MIRQYTIKSFDDIYSIGWLLTRWVFRGQADSNWPLSSKAERISGALKLIGPADLERFALERFRREAQQFVAHIPSKESSVDWLAFLQHHGGPTRLLDFTKSIYIALFFAIENSSSDAIIWAFNERKIFEKLGQKTEDGDRPPTRDYTRSHKLINGREQQEGVYDPGLLPVMPHWMSDRQSIQQGVFLYPEDLRMLAKGDGNTEGKPHITFQDNLLAEFELMTKDLEEPEIVSSVRDLYYDRLHLDQAIARLIIPNDQDLRVHLLGELHAMNISARSLFPGIEGLARSYFFPKESYEVSRMWASARAPSAFLECFDREEQENTNEST